MNNLWIYIVFIIRCNVLFVCACFVYLLNVSVLRKSLTKILGWVKILQYFGNLNKFYSSYNKISLAFKVEAIVLHCLKPIFCQLVHADTNSCSSRERTLLKCPPLLGCWSVMSTGSEPLIGTNNNLRKLDLDYILDEVIFQPALWSHADTTSCLFKVKKSQWSFYLFSIVKAFKVQEVSHRSEKVIIQGSKVQTICWVWL